MALSAFYRQIGTRARATLLAGCAALALAGCTGDGGPSVNAKAMKALSPQTVALIQEKGMETTSPLVVRIFKEESELEVWKQKEDGDYALLKTYPICRWSGELGPKVKEGDRQAPEGFYTITPGQMNPNSSYYLSFNLGFPNAYDRAWGRTGAHLMVHGDCSSAGCYAMTDEQIQEIFALGRESFKGGQRAFQVQAYPFRMTADNMVRHRNNPNIAFWKMLKEGSDTFEISKAPPKVDVCGKRYVFNATPADPAQRFEPAATCPSYSVPDDLAGALASRARDTDRRIASASSLSPAAPVKTGKDGGMHQVFIAKLENPSAKAPGSLPAVVKPPGSDYGVATNEPAPAESIALANAASVTAPAVASSTTIAAAGGIPVPAARPTDAPGPARTQIAASSETRLFGSLAPLAATTQVASLDGEGFLSGVTRMFTREETPAAAAPAPAGSGFSLGSLFGSTPPAPAPAAAPVAMATPADVPVPPARPPVSTAAPRPAAAAPVHTPTPASAAPSAGAPAVAAVRAAPTIPVVPRPTTLPTIPAVPTPTAAASAPTAVPALRPSVASSSSQPLYGIAEALPGATILAPGAFSSTVQ